MKTITRDRRLFERFPSRFPVKYEYEDKDYGASVYLRDASAGGFKLTSRQRLFLDDGVSLEIKLPDASRPLRLNGRVVWIRLSGPDLWDAGVAFHKVDFMRIQRMYKFVSPD